MSVCVRGPPWEVVLVSASITPGLSFSIIPASGTSSLLSFGLAAFSSRCPCSFHPPDEILGCDLLPEPGPQSCISLHGCHNGSAGAGWFEGHRWALFRSRATKASSRKVLPELCAHWGLWCAIPSCFFSFKRLCVLLSSQQYNSRLSVYVAWGSTSPFPCLWF